MRKGGSRGGWIGLDWEGLKGLEGLEGLERLGEGKGIGNTRQRQRQVYRIHHKYLGTTYVST